MSITQQQIDQISDISRSLSFLVSSNGGAWKSAAQAGFVLNSLNSLTEPTAILAPQSSLTLASPLACSKMLVLSHHSTYRGRSFWVHYIVDEGGVILRGTHDLDPTGKVATIKKINFQRAPGRTPIANFFPKAGVKITRQNKTLLKKLKGMSFEPSPFTLSIINQLERGDMLSPKQMQAVQRVLLADQYGSHENLPSAGELRSRAKALGVTFPSNLSFTRSADKRTALSLLDAAEKRAKTKAVKRAFDQLGGSDGCYMSRQNLIATHSHLRDILKHLESNPCIEDWAESKISQAHAILQSVANYLNYGKG
jgi:hypothetical protein